MVRASRSRRGASWASREAQPPAASRSWMNRSPFGRMAVRRGTWSARRSKVAQTSIGQATSSATAWRCLTVFTEALAASITVTALVKAAGVITALGRRPSATISTIRRPAQSTPDHIFSLLAWHGLLPGGAMPRASAAMCIELAVPIPAHTPGPVIAWSAMAPSSSTPSSPVRTLPASKNTSSMSMWASQ